MQRSLGAKDDKGSRLTGSSSFRHSDTVAGRHFLFFWVATRVVLGFFFFFLRKNEALSAPVVEGGGQAVEGAYAVAAFGVGRFDRDAGSAPFDDVGFRGVRGALRFS